jgi:hypothetical protein
LLQKVIFFKSFLNFYLNLFFIIFKFIGIFGHYFPHKNGHLNDPGKRPDCRIKAVLLVRFSGIDERSYEAKKAIALQAIETMRVEVPLLEAEGKLKRLGLPASTQEHWMNREFCHKVS